MGQVSCGASRSTSATADRHTSARTPHHSAPDRLDPSRLAPGCRQSRSARPAKVQRGPPDRGARSVRTERPSRPSRRFPSLRAGLPTTLREIVDGDGRCPLTHHHPVSSLHCGHHRVLASRPARSEDVCQGMHIDCSAAAAPHPSVADGEGEYGVGSDASGELGRPPVPGTGTPLRRQRIRRALEHDQQRRHRLRRRSQADARVAVARSGPLHRSRRRRGRHPGCHFERAALHLWQQRRRPARARDRDVHSATRRRRRSTYPRDQGRLGRREVICAREPRDRRGAAVRSRGPSQTPTGRVRPPHRSPTPRNGPARSTKGRQRHRRQGYEDPPVGRTPVIGGSDGNGDRRVSDAAPPGQVPAPDPA